MVTFRFRLTEEEYFNYNYFTAWAAPERKAYRYRYFARVFLLYGAVAALYIIFTRQHLIWVDIAVFVLIGCIYLMLVPFFIRKSIGRKVQEILKQPENEHVLQDAEIILTDGGIIDRDTVSETRYAWD